MFPLLATETSEHAVSLSVTLGFCALLLGLIVCLALEEKIHAKKSVIAGGFAILCLLLGAGFGLYTFSENHTYDVQLPGGHDL